MNKIIECSPEKPEQDSEGNCISIVRGAVVTVSWRSDVHYWTGGEKIADKYQEGAKKKKEAA